ncbi:MAG: hypothetical protein KDA57_15065 [Planctomycetales bacterium]|nr:hypothetical protein [Planctomycetales bacterium]
MEWTDTMMLEENRPLQFFDPRRFNEGASVDSVKAVSARVLAVQGLSLLHASGRTNDEFSAALEILRGFRATGRRVVLCDTTRMAPGRQAGNSVVVRGGAGVVVSCGPHGRELAIGARDAGLDLASVVVCRDVKAACEALVHRLCPGDTVMLWGVEQETCNRLVMWLDRRFSEPTSAAA